VAIGIGERVRGLADRAKATNRWVEEHPPPGPFRPGFWRSPIRGPWLTSVLGSVLLFGVPIMFITGLLDFLAYNPWLPGNGGREGSRILTFIPFHWPTRPSWGFRLSQGIHVTRREDGVALPALAFAHMRAPESRCAARLLGTKSSSGGEHPFRRRSGRRDLRRVLTPSSGLRRTASLAGHTGRAMLQG